MTGDEASLLTCLPLLRRLEQMLEDGPDTTPEDDDGEETEE
ncbi:MAG: hypothetical protein VYB54_04800 [Pseudomonadota bacterium]|nr:hypothetical protein [Pseudomonadota bacterium]